MHVYACHIITGTQTRGARRSNTMHVEPPPVLWRMSGLMLETRRRSNLSRKIPNSQARTGTEEKHYTELVKAGSAIMHC